MSQQGKDWTHFQHPRMHMRRCPQPAALFANDCAHVAAALLALPHAFAPRLTCLAPSAPLRLVGAARRLRRAGADVLNAQVCSVVPCRGVPTAAACHCFGLHARRSPCMPFNNVFCA